jgi:hypothetical protein
MGNITGNPFDPGVIKQINTRQAFLGVDQKQDKHIIYQNNKTAFLRLASSIRIDGYNNGQVGLLDPQNPNFVSPATILEQRGLPASYAGNSLAKAAVLFGGIVNINNTNNPQLNYGLKENFDINDPFTSAYGWGGINSQGYRPMPGIISANISFYNRGALAKAEVKCKVYSIEQLQVFDLLYFRIGYSMLLEWGHNVYVNNEAELKSRDTFNTDAFNLFFSETNPSQDDIIAAIKKERKKSSYNYDGMLGKVTNFTWKFNADGSYDVDLKLVGYGDIIEALKINVSEGGQPKAIAQGLKQKVGNVDGELKKLEDEVKLIPASLKYSFLNIGRSIEDVNANLQKLKDLETKVSNNISVGGSDSVNIKDFGQSNSSKAFNFLNRRINPSGTKDGAIVRDAELNQINTAISNDNDILIYIQLGQKSYISPENTVKSISDLPKAPKGLSNGPFSYVREILTKNKKLVETQTSTSTALELENSFPQVAKEYADTTRFNKQIYSWIKKIDSGIYDKEELASINFKVQSDNSTKSGQKKLARNQYYVRLGYMLEYMEDNLLVYDNTKTITKKRKIYNTNPKTGEEIATYNIQDVSLPNPFFTIDTTTNLTKSVTENTDENIDNDSIKQNNYCLRFPFQVSADPLICIIPCKLKTDTNIGNNNNTKDKNTPFTGWEYLTNLSAYFDEENKDVAKVMNIFINLDFIASTLDKLIDKNGKVSLLKFLENICNGINDALGNVNKLEAQYDGETNTLKIIEGSKLDFTSLKKKNPKIGIFEVYGAQIGIKGSFITNVDFQVQLPPSMAAMATISAQASGNIVGENATGLSKLNKGIIDRIAVTKLDASSIEGLTSKDSKEDPEKLLAEKIANMAKYLKQLYTDNEYIKPNVQALKSINRDVAAYTVGIAVEKNVRSAPFFIPFNLSLDMDGLSGMRNYERFAINESVLPYSYRSADQPGGVIDFLIKGVSHTIASNKWTTKIESLTVSSNRTL